MFEVNHGHFVAVDVVRAFQTLVEVEPLSEKEGEEIRSLIRRYASIPRNEERKKANALALADLICEKVIITY